LAPDYFSFVCHPVGTLPGCAYLRSVGWLLHHELRANSPSLPAFYDSRHIFYDPRQIFTTLVKFLRPSSNFYDTRRIFTTLVKFTLLN